MKDLPLELITGPDGNIWVTMWTGASVDVYSTAGAFVKSIHVGDYPYGIGNGANGSVWVGIPGGLAEITSDERVVTYKLPQGDHEVVSIAYDPTTSRVWFAGPSPQGYIGYVVHGAKPHVIAISTGASAVAYIPGSGIWFTTNTKTVGHVATGDSLVSYSIARGFNPITSALCYGPDGRIWIAIQHGWRASGTLAAFLPP